MLGSPKKVSDETQKFPYPTLEEWDGMLRRCPEDVARFVYPLAVHLRNDLPPHVLALMQYAETVLAERFPDLKRPH